MFKNRTRRFWVGIALLIIVLVVLGFFLSAYQLDNRVVRATELFGKGRMVSVFEKDPEDGDLFLGLIVADSRLFFLHGRVFGRETQCVLRKVLGGAIKDYHGPIACLMVQTGQTKFVGWIEFRDHHREFCGANTASNLPVKCRWGEE